MPGNARFNKPSHARNVSEQEEAKHSSLEQQSHPVKADNRRTRSRRVEVEPIEDAMDVALGTEDEKWERRRGPRRKKAA